MPLDDLAERLAEAARALRTEDVVQTLERAVSLAVEMVTGCDGAGVTMLRHGRAPETPAATSDWVSHGDALQYELQQGPCIDALWEHEVVTSSDLSDLMRWPVWGPRVVDEVGVRSVLCLQLFTNRDTVGALNMYGQSPGAFDDVLDQHEGQALATHIALALTAAQEIEHLNLAVRSRTVIGQAEGILMERFDMDAAHAFAVLKRVSQHSNVKLFQVAVELVRSRRLPPGVGPGPRERLPASYPMGAGGTGKTVSGSWRMVGESRGIGLVSRGRDQPLPPKSPRCGRPTAERLEGTLRTENLRRVSTTRSDCPGPGQTASRTIRRRLRRLPMSAQADAWIIDQLGPREVIGRAVDLLMKRHGVDEAAAFEMLVKGSSDSHERVREIAAGVLLEARAS
jgi:AmiR/NasT family two-component response regulator